MKLEHCRSCNAEIVWLKTATGRSIPVDADTVNEGDDLFLPKSKANPEKFHVSHFATCPQANRWRKK